MNEIIFLIEESPDGIFTAKALEYSIYTEAETMIELKENIKDAVLCHFEDGNAPKMIRLHFVKDEVFVV